MTTGPRPAAGSAPSRKRDKRLLLPVREVAEMFGVSRSTIVRAYESGEFPAVKFRGTYRVPRRFVDDLLSAAIPGRLVVVEEYAAEWTARNGAPLAPGAAA
jgi:excisionase family DNA binding protein